MDERGRERFDRSRYGSRARAASSQDSRSTRNRSDSYGRIRVTDDDPGGVRVSQRGSQRTSHDRSSYSRTAVDRQTASRKKPRVSAFKVIIIAIVAVVVIGAGAAFAYVSNISNNLHEGVDQELRDALVHTDMANEPFYMLLLGTDASDDREETGETDGVYRSDSMMLARIDPQNKKATLISIGRDIMVDLGPEYGEQKINAAYAFGGAPLAVEAVSKLAGVPISHYAEIDFDGFKAMVDSLGGIEIDVPMKIDDWMAGGVVEAGYQTIDGNSALVLCRARNAYADSATRPDDMRTANQRLVLGAIARKLLASDIATIASSVSAMSEYVTTDLELNDIIGLAQAMRGLDPDTDLYTASVPATSQYINDVSCDFVVDKEWKAMMDRVKAGEPPLEEAVVDEATGTVLATAGNGTTSTAEKYASVIVKNATGIDGLAAEVRKKLMDAGFVNVMYGDVTPGYSYPETLVLYNDPGRAREAEEIVKIIGQGRAEENDGSYLLVDCDLMVIIGDDWQR